jgi:hypothetical protein
LIAGSSQLMQGGRGIDVIGTQGSFSQLHCPTAPAAPSLPAPRTEWSQNDK